MEKKKFTFASLGLSPWLCNVLENLDITEPTPIQKMCIPETLNGKVVIGMSETGSGKTAAFVLPILDQLVRDLYGPFALIVAPTRELAFQIERAVHSFSGNFDVRTALVIGGVSMTRQASVLESRPHFVVGTPGRLEELIRSYPDSKFFRRVRFLVFDEADRILNVKFSLDISVILEACSPHRQTLLYSATMNAHVKKLAKLAIGKDQATRDRVFVCDASQLYRPVQKLKQYYMFVPEFVKECYLYAFLRTKVESKRYVTAIVFMQKMKECELVSRTMKGMGISTVSLHSTKHQRDRLAALESFRRREARVLVCTDVAARGLDIPDVTYVLNFDVPGKTEDYIHRVGRTARQGLSGVAVSLVSPNEVSRIHLIEKQTRVKLQEYKGFGKSGEKRLEKEIEEKVYEIGEKRCRAKIGMLQDGFYEQYQKRRDIIGQGKKLEKSIRKYFQKKKLFQDENNSGSNDLVLIPPPPPPPPSNIPTTTTNENNNINIRSDGKRKRGSNSNKKKKRGFEKRDDRRQEESRKIDFGGVTLLKKRKRKMKRKKMGNINNKKHKKRKF